MSPLDRRAFLRTSTAAGLVVTPVVSRSAAETTASRRYRRRLPKGWTYPVAADLLPFGHGVMSGDPLTDRVVLWTRVTIPDRRGWDATEVRDPQGFRRVVVRWVVARDPDLRHVVRRGRVTTSAARDWTVKVDADRLPAGTTLYYADPQLIRAHHAAPWAIMADQHDYDPATVDDVVTLTTEQAGQVFFEWTPVRPPRPDGSGEFPESPGPRRQLPVPKGTDALYVYRTLPYGDLADVVLLDVRRFADREGEESQVLGDVQWSWLERVMTSSTAAFRVVVNQVNLGQLRAFNLPFASAFADAFGMDPNAPEGELYTTSWGGHPAERTRLMRFLRDAGVIDNVVLSGDSHGFFGNDLVEDPQVPAYEPLTGGGTLGAVGVELVGSTAGRPGGQDVIAEDLYFAAVGGSRGAAFEDAATYDAEYRTAALAPTLALEAAAQAANPQLRFFNWRADYGYAVVQVQPDQTVLESWTVPQREVSTEQTLLAQHTTAKGAPHLSQVLSPEPVTGPPRGEPAPTAATTRSH